MSDGTMNVLVFSGDSSTRKAVIEGVGRRPAKDLPTLNWFEAATAWGAEESFCANTPGLVILDGETTKEGGMSVARLLEDRFDDVPPILLIIARPQDKWLADWAGAADVINLPLDPLDLQERVSSVLRGVS